MKTSIRKKIIILSLILLLFLTVIPVQADRCSDAYNLCKVVGLIAFGNAGYTATITYCSIGYAWCLAYT